MTAQDHIRAHLFNILGRAYDARVRGIGKIKDITDDFVAASKNHDFAEMARNRLGEINALAAETGEDRLEKRDFVASVQREFLREAMRHAK